MTAQFNWFKQNVFQIIAIITSAFAIYLGVSDRITILEQKAYANEKEHQSTSQVLQELKKDLGDRMADLKTDIKEVDKKTNEMYKVIIKE